MLDTTLVRSRSFVVSGLKAGEADPEHLGKLNFYVNAVDHQLRRVEYGDEPTIGVLLVATRDDVVVEYSLEGLTAPMAVSTYRTHHTLPADVRSALPSPNELARIVRSVQKDDPQAAP